MTAQAAEIIFCCLQRKQCFAEFITLPGSLEAQHHTALKIQQALTPELKPKSLLQCSSKESCPAGVYS